MHRLHIGNNRPDDICKLGSSRIPRTIEAELASRVRRHKSRRYEDPGLVLRIHIHLGRNRHVILRTRSSHNASKSKERHFRKRLKERKLPFDESTLFTPTRQRQSATPVQPCAIVVFSQSFLPGNIRPKIPRIVSGRCSPAEPSSVYDRSNALGPSIFISHRSFACEPRIDTRQSPGRSASTCSITAATSRCDAASPVWCISTKTAISLENITCP